MALSLRWLAGRVPFSRQAVSKHLVVLERAGLISRRKQGKEVLYQVEADSLDQATWAMADSLDQATWAMADSLDQATWAMAELAAQWDRRLAGIKRLAETAHAENEKEDKKRR
jgi:DNA-binding transcriptional ArsR family regulator